MGDFRRIAVALVVLMACDGGGGSPGPRTTILDPGAGDANVGPLWALTVGSRSMGQSGTLVLDGRAELDGREVIRGVTDGVAVVYFGDSAEGIVVHGSSRVGLFAHPMLLVPSTVRVGMRWRADTGAAAFELEIVSREEQDTIYGRVPVWRIHNDAFLLGLPETIAYAEGFGLHDGFTADHSVFTITPLAAPGAPTVELGAIALSPVSTEAGGPAVWPLRQEVELSAVQTSAGVHILMHVLEPSVSGGAIVPGRQDLCALYRDGVIVTTDYVADDPACPVTPTASGGRRARSVGAYAYAVGPDPVWGIYDAPIDLEALNPPVELQPSAVVVAGLAGDGGPELRVWRRGAFDAMLTREVDDAIGMRWHDNVTALREHAAFGVGVRYRFLGIAARPFDAASPIAIIGRGGIVSHARVDDGVGIVRPIPAFGTAGRFVVRATGDDRDVLIVSHDGLVDRLVIDDGDLSIVRLGALELPPLHYLAAAFAVEPDRLLVVTQVGGPPVPGRSVGETNFGELRAFTAPLPSSAPAPRAPLASLGVTARVAGADLVVCTPSSTAAPSTSGWMLGGAAARAAFDLGDGCVLVARDPDVAAPSRGDGANHLAEGDIPGAGRVRIATTSPIGGLLGETFINMPDLEDHDPFELLSGLRAAPLTGGGFATLWNLYGSPGGVREPSRAHPLDFPIGGTLGSTPWCADAAGNGLWAVHSDGTSAAQTLALHGRDGGVVTALGDVAIVGVAAGGGVLITGPSTQAMRFVDPTGAATAVRAETADALIVFDRYDAVRLADGTVCGDTAAGLLCQGPTGAARLADPSDPLLAYARGEKLPLPDGSFVSTYYANELQPTATVHVDPATMAITLIDEREVFNAVHASDGTLWGIAWTPAAPFMAVHTVVEVTATGLIEHPTGDLARAFGDKVPGERAGSVFEAPPVAVAVIPTDDYLLVLVEPNCGTGPACSERYVSYLAMPR